MEPVVSVAEMRAIDAEAQRAVPLEDLVERAGSAVAAEALHMMGGAYGRRVAVVVGKGNNGADGRVAAERLRRRGVRVALVDAADALDRLPAGLDLVIDAAYGTGFHGSYTAPATDAAVLAVDIPSGVDGDTGTAEGGGGSAVATVTFAALKPGLLFGAGAQRSGRVRVADIGLDCSGAAAWLVTDADVAAAPLGRSRESHKWRSALGVVAGAPGMMGAPGFSVRGAQRAGAGMVRLGVPGAGPGDLPVSEAVSTDLPADWAEFALEWVSHCRAVVVGPGLGRAETTRAAVRQLAARTGVPLLVDADGLHALGRDASKVLAGRKAPTVLTPHDGEFETLTGSAPGPDRLGAARGLAADCGAVVLLKGSTTVVADPEGRVLIAASGSSRLATAGTGDVLSGIIGAFLAGGIEPLLAAGLGAHVHGRAAARGRPVGLVAGDLPDLVSDVLGELTGPAHAGTP
ncbi:MAG: NAD(P)H-hydrate dehydratase [Acidimicrobiales bacterium]